MYFGSISSKMALLNRIRKTTRFPTGSLTNENAALGINES